MKQKRTQRLKRVVSGLLSLSMITSMSAVIPVNAEEEGKQSAYPYTVFAADENGGITLNLDYLTVNGNGVTNGVYSTTAMYPNINGTISENEFVVDEIVSDDENTTDSQDADKPFDVSRDMIYIHNKLMDSWFNNAQNYAEDYTLSEMNINLNSPVYVTGRLLYQGNVALNSAIGAVSDVTLSGGNLNGNNAVIYSKFGDIKITDSQASMNGLIYAPFGTVTIDCDNFNLNGLIIAQNVVLNSTGANINYSNTWAEFVGTETEELSWTFADWKYLADTDEDGLPNLVEKELGTKPYEADTDGDLLPDGYEVLSLGTDPLKVDTDDNDISDYDEDFDTDGLSNGQEYEIGTRPYNDDSDGDNLKDGDEVNTYFTDPLDVDTDDDNLNDDDEIYFGTDPNDPDSDDNGTKDGDEKRSQKFIHKVENEDCAVSEVIVSMEATGNLQKTTTVESIMNKDMLCTGVVGLVGEPFSIETTSDYEKATLTYVIDKNKLGDTEFDNLMFLWYDEKKDEFVELDTILDEENSTVSINTPHFSKYMLVDKKEWFDAWKRASLYFQDEYEPLAAAICYDCSGSMSGNDPNGYRKLAIDNFIDSMTLTDKTALISFEDKAKLVSGFSDNKEELKGLVNPYFGGGTNVRASVEMAIEQLNTVQHWYTRHIILLSDGDVNININLANNTVDDLIKKAVDNNIKIHTIGLGSGADKQKLKDCAEYTGGQYFTAETAEKLDAIYKDLSKNNHFDLKTLPDNDEDGLPDEFEVSGLVISNAQIFYTDPEVQDCDGDGLIDGKEISIDDAKSKTVTVHGADGGYTTYSTVVFKYISNPNEKYCSGNEFDATKHTLEYDGETYKCTKCAFSAHEPAFEDSQILNKDDYNLMIALNYMLYKISSEEVTYYKDTHDMYILQLIGEIDKIRQKEEYNNKYSFSDSDGRCIPSILESDEYKSIYAGSKCDIIQETINESNYRSYNYWYGNGQTYIVYGIGFIDPYLGASLFWLNDITAPETIDKDNGQMLIICMSSFIKNFAYIIGSDYDFVINKSKISGDKKWERDFMYTMASLCNDTLANASEKDEYDLQLGDTFVHANYGSYCVKCLEDPNHEDSLSYGEKREHFKYTRYRRDTVWMRDGKILFYHRVDG